MRVLACFALAVVLIPMSGLHARADPDRASLSALIRELSSGDFKARRVAADQIIQAGYITIERAARQSASLNKESWEAFADAFIRCDRQGYAVALVAAAHASPEAHAHRLIDLARHLNPKAGTTPPTPEEIEAIVRHELIEVQMADEESFESATGIFGHAGVPATLKLLRQEDTDTVDQFRASETLRRNAQPEDIPAMRTLLLEGKSSVAAALHRLDSLGFTEASDALFDGVRAGQFDSRIAYALGRLPNRSRAARAMREWIAARGRSLTEGDRAEAARVFATLGSRTDVPTLEAWTNVSRNWTVLLDVGKALTKLGSARGIEALVQIVEKEIVDSAPKEAPEHTGRLRAKGSKGWHRNSALRAIKELAAELSGRGCCQEPLPWEGIPYRAIDRKGVAVRAWWEALRDRVQFDEQAGKWRLKSD